MACDDDTVITLRNGHAPTAGRKRVSTRNAVRERKPHRKWLEYEIRKEKEEGDVFTSHTITETEAESSNRSATDKRAQNCELTVRTQVSTVYLQLKFSEMQNDYLTQTLV